MIPGKSASSSSLLSLSLRQFCVFTLCASSTIVCPSSFSYTCYFLCCLHVVIFFTLSPLLLSLQLVFSNMSFPVISLYAVLSSPFTSYYHFFCCTYFYRYCISISVFYISVFVFSTTVDIDALSATC